MLPPKLAFVDIETTGLRSFYDRIIEVGIVRYEYGEITKTYSTLIDPQSYIPTEITKITGISHSDLETAPTFRQIKGKVQTMLDDCVFIAHNVRFDYSFIKNEFKRVNIPFLTKQLCTVKLSRNLYPQFQHHNLDSIIKRFGFQCQNRHRAMDDAQILVKFYQKILYDFPKNHIEKVILKQLKKPSTPLRLKTDISNIPQKAGVYIFYGSQNTPIYVGKSINLRSRIISHFNSDIRSPLEMKIAQQIENIEIIETAGELGALLLESQLIKEMLPLYNKKSRIKHELTSIKSKINNKGYYQASVETIKTGHTNPYNNQIYSILGLFKSKKQAKNHLSVIAKEFSLCEKLLGLESNSKSSKYPCFSYRLGNCKGACLGKENPKDYNLRFKSAFSSTQIKSWPFPGPIIITEKSESKEENYIFDKWCYIEKVNVDPEDNSLNKIKKSIAFDFDNYKILKQFILNSKNLSKIKIISSKRNLKSK